MAVGNRVLLTALVQNSKFPDCPRNCERRALKVEIAATTRESGYPPMKRHFVCRARCFGEGSVPFLCTCSKDVAERACFEINSA